MTYPGRAHGIALLIAAALFVGCSFSKEQVDIAPLAPQMSVQSSCDRDRFRIVLDVGHTAEEPGATSARGIPEFVFNFRLAQHLRQQLIGAGFAQTEVLITAGASFSGLLQRVASVNRMAPTCFCRFIMIPCRRLFLNDGSTRESSSASAIGSEVMRYLSRLRAVTFRRACFSPDISVTNESARPAIRFPLHAAIYGQTPPRIAGRRGRRLPFRSADGAEKDASTGCSARSRLDREPGRGVRARLTRTSGDNRYGRHPSRHGFLFFTTLLGFLYHPLRLTWCAVPERICHADNESLYDIDSGVLLFQISVALGYTTCITWLRRGRLEAARPFHNGR
jgi:hypothetical protein